MARIVYIVNDKSSERAACSFLLRRHGFETRLYDGAAEFLKISSVDGCIIAKMRMAGMNGLELHHEMMARGIAIPVIILDGDVPQAVRAMQQGAVDFITLPYDDDELVHAVDRAFILADDGERQRHIKAEAAAKLSALNARGIQVLQGLHAGMTNAMIARWLDLSPRTVEAYRAAMMAEIGATSVSHALRIAIDGGLPPIDQRGAEMAMSG